MSHLLEFYGKECPHCIRMHELVEKLEKEEGIKMDSIEVWHNKENEEKMAAIECFDECGGVPFFYNTKTKKFICGEESYEKFKSWAQDK